MCNRPNKKAMHFLKIIMLNVISQGYSESNELFINGNVFIIRN